MLQKYNHYKEELNKIEKELSSPDISSDTKKLAELSKKHRIASEIVKEFELLKKIQEEIEETESIIRTEEGEMATMMEDELARLQKIREDQKSRIELSLIPKDPNDSKNAIIEIRAGAGGEESSLFASELYRMYHNYAEKNKWEMNIMDLSESDNGGFKEVVAEIKGKDIYSKLKYESGVHRVQRVPQTESQGRVHTSTVTVAVLPEAEEVDIEISPNDIRVDVFRSGGAGGQSVNTTDSAVRLTHIPTGVVVTCQNERSQLQNRLKALAVLRTRLYESKLEEEAKKRGDARKSQIGTGDRSEKIRTYNFPQDRVTDHRIGFSTSNLPGFMDGNIQPMIDALYQADREKALKSI